MIASVFERQKDVAGWVDVPHLAFDGLHGCDYIGSRGHSCRSLKGHSRLEIVDAYFLAVYDRLKGFGRVGDMADRAVFDPQHQVVARY